MIDLMYCAGGNPRLSHIAHEEGWLLDQKRLIAHALNPQYPGYCGCLRCYRNWGYSQYHETAYDWSHTAFPLCEECWQQLSSEERLTYYRELWKMWNSGKAEEWHAIEEAVRKGL